MIPSTSPWTTAIQREPATARDCTLGGARLKDRVGPGADPGSCGDGRRDPHGPAAKGRGSCEEPVCADRLAAMEKKETPTTDRGPAPRLFTLEEAHLVLPEIEPLVARMKTIFASIRNEIAEASTATGIPPGSPRLSEHLEIRGVAPRLVAEINDLIRRVHQLGCLVNGPEAGLVDFPALLGTEIVYLCWMHGEARIDHWHRIPDGFSGRRPLLDPEASSTPRGGAPIVH